MLREKIQRIAAYAFNASTESIRIESGVITVEGSPQISSTIAQIAQMAYLTPDRLPPGMEMGLESQYRLRPPMMVFANATHACVCEVDVETGKVAILRWVAGGDCGQLINPSIVEGQISGGVVQGIAGVLFENFRYDDSGQPMTATLKDYLLPTALDVPRVEFRHMCTPSTTPGGFKGVGEGGAMISPPALVNAIADALAPFGKRWLNMPLSPDRIICGLEDDA
jgi:carbon-monoxide dehydrogenase large subunit